MGFITIYTVVMQFCRNQNFRYVVQMTLLLWSAHHKVSHKRTTVSNYVLVCILIVNFSHSRVLNAFSCLVLRLHQLHCIDNEISILESNKQPLMRLDSWDYFSWQENQCFLSCCNTTNKIQFHFRILCYLTLSPNFLSIRSCSRVISIAY